MAVTAVEVLAGVASLGEPATPCIPNIPHRSASSAHCRLPSCVAGPSGSGERTATSRARIAAGQPDERPGDERRIASWRARRGAVHRPLDRTYTRGSQENRTARGSPSRLRMGADVETTARLGPGRLCAVTACGANGGSGVANAADGTQQCLDQANDAAPPRPRQSYPASVNRHRRTSPCGQGCGHGL